MFPVMSTPIDVVSNLTEPLWYNLTSAVVLPTIEFLVPATFCTINKLDLLYNEPWPTSSI